MNFTCKCVPSVTLEELKPVIETPDYTPKPDVTTTIIFEPTTVGTTAKKSFKIHNHSKYSQMYILKRDPKTNPIYHVFDFKILNETVKGGDYLNCTITYSPQLPNQKSVDYFQVVNVNFNVHKVCVRGESIGPIVTISTKTLFFYNTDMNQKLSNTFEISNKSNSRVNFQFDVNEESNDQELFKIDKIRDNLAPHSHAYITIKFSTRKLGIYATNLVCLVPNQPPLMVQLIGIMIPTIIFDPLLVTLKSFSDTYPTHGYDGYMYDSVKKTTKRPPFSLAANYLDFGSVKFEEGSSNSHTLVTSLTNHLDQPIEVVWINEHSSVFSITPREITIPSEESVTYECNFKPNSSDCIYSKVITAYVHWSDRRKTLKEAEVLEVIEVPLNINLKLLGTSFPKNKIWLPIVELNPNVILPPTTPTVPSYTTTLLISSGHLPTFFKFVPPKKSHFLLKPMEGVIYNFQIIVLQLQPDIQDKKAYIEHWGLDLNGRSEDCISVFLKGFSETPSISVANNNTVAFRPVHPCSQDILNVPVTNCTVHHIRYSFVLQPNSQVSMDHPQGELTSNENVMLQWCCTGALKAPKTSTIKCQLQTIDDNKMIIGIPNDVFITVCSNCVYSELCATPNSYNFDQVEFGSTISTSFYLFNFGESPIHFHLCQKQFETATCEISILPSKGTVEPEGKVKIVVTTKGTVIGVQEIKLIYKVRLSSISDLIVNNEEEHDIFTLHLHCLYPTVQVADISSNNFGSLFSKVMLWRMFNIDEFNHALVSIEHDETKSVQLYVPDNELSDANFFATLVIRNPTNFPTEVIFKRKKSCSCKIVEKTRGMSFREYVYECVHIDMLKINLESDTVGANLISNLRMDVKYLEHGLMKILYIVSMSYNRTINLYVNVNVLPQKVTMPSKYFNSYDLRMRHVFLGEQDPPAQGFPLYNNSKFIVNYEVDVIPLSKINFDYDFEIFKCINPNGTLLPFSMCHILFKFHPITKEEYKVAVPIKMGDNSAVLNIEGKGSMQFKNNLSTTCSLSCHKSRNAENPVDFSTDHLLMEPMQVWSATQRMIFIRNQTSDKIIGYSWQNGVETGVVTAEVVQKKGVLRPKEAHPIIIKIQCLDQPCILNLQMACKLLDHTQYIRHEESVVEYNQREGELDGQFTITEKGTSFPKNDVEVLPKPENFFLTLCIDICIISTRDRDICLTIKQQMANQPETQLRIDAGAIFIDYVRSLLRKESDEVVQKRKEMVKLKIPLNIYNIDLVKFVVECLLADTILNNLFPHLLYFANHLYQAYYLQYTIDEEISRPHTRKSVLKEKHKKGLKKHVVLVKSCLNAPDGRALQHIFKELLTDSVHSTYNLGPRETSKPKNEFIYHSIKSKFRCPVCKCNN